MGASSAGPIPGTFVAAAAAVSASGSSSSQPIAIAAPQIAANTIEINRQRRQQRRKASEAAKRREAVGLDVEEEWLASQLKNGDGSGGGPFSGGGLFRGNGGGTTGAASQTHASHSGVHSMTAMEEFEAAMGDFQWGMDVTNHQTHGSGRGGHGTGAVQHSQTGSATGGAGAFASSWIGKVTGAASGRRYSEVGGGMDRNGTHTHTSAHSTNSIRSGACVESLGSTLNRQASILMLLYPMAYVLLFSVSIIRIVVDLADPVPLGGMEMRSQRALHSVARWFIFAQGLFDAIIFQLVERHFRSRMKRRRKEALGEPVPLTAWQMLKLWTRTLVFGHGPRK